MAYADEAWRVTGSFFFSEATYFQELKFPPTTFREPEFELILSHVTQKPALRVGVYARA